MADTDINKNVALHLAADSKGISELNKELLATITNTAKVSKNVHDMAKAGKDAMAGFKSLTSQITSFAGATISMNGSIRKAVTYNKQLLSLSAQWNKYGKSIVDVEKKIEGMAKSLSITRSEAMSLSSALEKALPLSTFASAEKILRNISKAVGANADAMKEMSSLVSEISSMYPGMQSSLENLSEEDKKRIQSHAKILFLMGKINQQQYRGLTDYTLQNKQISQADKEKQDRAKKYTEIMGQMKQFWEKIAIVMGQAIMPSMKIISEFLIKNQESITKIVTFATKWVAPMLIIKGVFGGIFASVKGIFGMARGGMGLLGTLGGFAKGGKAGGGIAAAGGGVVSKLLGGASSSGGKGIPVFVTNLGFGGAAKNALGGGSSIQNILNPGGGGGLRGAPTGNLGRSLVSLRGTGRRMARGFASGGIRGAARGGITGIGKAIGRGIGIGGGAKGLGMLAKGAKLASLGGIATLGGELGFGALESHYEKKGNVKGAAGAGIGKSASKIGGMALTGAAIGSVIPGLGTGVGAAVGGVVAFLMELPKIFKNLKKLLEGTKLGQALKFLGRKLKDAFTWTGKVLKDFGGFLAKMFMGLGLVLKKAWEWFKKYTPSGWIMMAGEWVGKQAINAMAGAQDQYDKDTAVKAKEYRATQIKKREEQAAAEAVIKTKDTNLLTAASGAGTPEGQGNWKKTIEGEYANIGGREKAIKERKEEPEYKALAEKIESRKKDLAAAKQAVADYKKEGYEEAAKAAQKEVDSLSEALKTNEMRLKAGYGDIATEEAKISAEKTKLINLEKYVIQLGEARAAQAQSELSLIQSQVQARAMTTKFVVDDMDTENAIKKVSEKRVALQAQLAELKRQGFTAGDAKAEAEYNTIIANREREITETLMEEVKAKRMVLDTTLQIASAQGGVASARAQELGILIQQNAWMGTNYDLESKLGDVIKEKREEQNKYKIAAQEAEKVIERTKDTDLAHMQAVTDLANAEAKIAATDREILQLRVQMLGKYEAEATLASQQTQLAEQSVQLLDQFVTGLGASAEMRMRAVEASQKELDVNRKQLNYLNSLSEADKSKPDIQKQINDLKIKELQITMKIAEQAKALREGWVDSIKAMQIGSGRISKIVVDSNKNLGLGLQYLGGMVRTYKSGAMGRAGEDVVGAMQSERFVADERGGGVGISGARWQAGYKTDTGLQLDTANTTTQNMRQKIEDQSRGAIARRNASRGTAWAGGTTAAEVARSTRMGGGGGGISLAEATGLAPAGTSGGSGGTVVPITMRFEINSNGDVNAVADKVGKLITKKLKNELGKVLQ